MCGLLAGAKGLGGQRGTRLALACAIAIEVAVWVWVACEWGGLSRVWSAANVALEIDAVVAYNLMVSPPLFVLGYVVGTLTARGSLGRSEDK
jgi:hypothetical protein